MVLVIYNTHSLRIAKVQCIHASKICIISAWNQTQRIHFLFLILRAIPYKVLVAPKRQLLIVINIYHAYQSRAFTLTIH